MFQIGVHQCIGNEINCFASFVWHKMWQNMFCSIWSSIIYRLCLPFIWHSDNTSYNSSFNLSIYSFSIYQSNASYNLSRHQFLNLMTRFLPERMLCWRAKTRLPDWRKLWSFFSGQIVTLELASFVGPWNLPYWRGGRGEEINFG